MTKENYYIFDFDEEVDKYFDDSSLAGDGQPRAIFIVGPVASGKSRHRRKFGQDFVHIDAGDIFINLSKGEYYDFPSHLEEPMELIGYAVAKRAVRERRHIVIELIGQDRERVGEVAGTLKALGYELGMAMMTCDEDVAIERNFARGENNISAYYSENYQREWLKVATHQMLEGFG